jgi:hypothetical protein
MLKCKKCGKEVTESETGWADKFIDTRTMTGNELGDGPTQKMTMRVRMHAGDCGGEILDQDSVEGVKNVLHPESQ